MSYEFYKILHYLSIMVLVLCMGLAFWSDRKSKLASISSGVSSLLLLTAGMVLLARLYPGVAWPLWAKAKIGIWLAIAILLPVLSKRLVNHRGKAFGFLLCLFFVAVYLAVMKPF